MMKESGVSFLGNNQLTKSVDGFKLALTQYSGNADFEEWHSHENGSISFLLSGTHHEDLLGKSLKRIPGDIKYIPAGELHRCDNYSANAKKINLELNDVAFKKMSLKEQQIESVLLATPQTKFTLLKLYHELDDTASHSTASAELLLYELFNKSESSSHATGKNVPLWVNTLRQLLHDDWNAKFDLESLSRIAGIHPVSLSRYFPKYFSSTLGTYVKHIKIQKALSMIRATDLSLTDIAYICGFADQAHFTRTFKEITGYLPKDFRKI